MCSEHGVEGDQELAHERGEGLDGAFSTGEEAIGEGLEGWIVASSGHGGHKQAGSEVAVAMFGDAELLGHRGAGRVLARVQICVGDPLECRLKRPRIPFGIGEEDGGPIYRQA